MSIERIFHHAACRGNFGCGQQARHTVKMPLPLAEMTIGWPKMPRCRCRSHRGRSSTQDCGHAAFSKYTRPACERQIDYSGVSRSKFVVYQRMDPVILLYDTLHRLESGMGQPGS